MHHYAEERMIIMDLDKRPVRSCVNCKHENKDICEEPCMDCNITLGNDKWEDKT